MNRTTAARDILTTDSLNRGDFAANPFFPQQSAYSSNLQAEHVTQPGFSTEERPMSDGVWGTYECLDLMAQCVRGEIGPDYCGYDHPYVQSLADEITQHSRSPQDEARVILDYVKQHIRYVPHPISTQVVKDAQRTVESGEGDCVSMSVLIATLLAARGMPVRFCVQYTSDQELYTHVFSETQIAGELIALDAVAREKPIGWIQSLPDGGFNYTHEIF